MHQCQGGGENREMPRTTLTQGHTGSGGACLASSKCQQFYCYSCSYAWGTIVTQPQIRVLSTCVSVCLCWGSVYLVGSRLEGNKSIWQALAKDPEINGDLNSAPLQRQCSPFHSGIFHIILVTQGIEFHCVWSILSQGRLISNNREGNLVSFNSWLMAQKTMV